MPNASWSFPIWSRADLLSGRAWPRRRHLPHAEGWSAPAFVSIGGGSWGLQIGVEGVDLVMLVMNDHGLQHMLSSKFKVGADASAAGPVGRHASAGTDWKMDIRDPHLLALERRIRGHFS